jgi:cytidylate kinase
MEVYGKTKEEARALIEESDATRQRYFELMTGHDWNCAEDYHLSIDTSLLPLEEIAAMVIELAKRKK